MKHYLWNRFIFHFLKYVAGPFVKLIMGYRCHKNKGPDAPSFIISNHNTNLDPALVGMGFSRHMYFTTSEHALRNGFPSKVLNFIFAPISINKTRTDVASIKEIIRRIKAGANVCLFAEGDRSFTGLTAPVSLSAAKLAKASGADLITFRLEGGYFTSPRWSHSMRRGKMSGGAVNKYPAAKLKTMSDKQVLEAIERDIFEDAYECQKAESVRYRGKNLAEHIETALYLCPGCKRIGTIRSKGDRFFCGCGLSARYMETGFLEGEALPFSTTTEWGKWQAEQLEMIVNKAGDEPICTDDGQQLFEVRTAIDKVLVGEGAMWISREAFHCAGMTFPLQEITRLATVGQMTLLFARNNGTTYEVRSPTPRNALVYREIFRILMRSAVRKKTEDRRQKTE